MAIRIDCLKSAFPESGITAYYSVFNMEMQGEEKWESNESFYRAGQYSPSSTCKYGSFDGITFGSIELLAQYRTLHN